MKNLPTAIRDGKRLSVFLEPEDDSQRLGRPIASYVESYPLPHVCCTAKSVWGATRRTHVAHKEGGAFDSLPLFFYTSALPLYGLCWAKDEYDSLRSGTVHVRVLSAAQYRRVQFRLRPAGKSVWSHDAPDRIGDLSESISAGCEHYIVYEDEMGLIRSHPLDLAFLFTKTGSVEFIVEHALLPPAFTHPEAFLRGVEKSVGDLKSTFEDPDFGATSPMPAYSAFRKFRKNGQGYEMKRGKADSPITGKEISVFAV